MRRRARQGIRQNKLNPGLPVPRSDSFPVRRLFFDIETSPNVMFSWRAGYRLDLSYESIIQERKIITVAWKWQNAPKTHVLVWDGDHCDRRLIERFLPILARADEVVAHFGDGFDVPWIRTRALVHGFTLPILKTIDTKAWASKYFYFNSNKLDYLAKLS